jgi:CDP-glycerol glycerophosphotransferase
VISAALVRRLVLRRRRKAVPGRIVLFGHALTGNLEAFARYLTAEHPEVEVDVLLDRPSEWRRLRDSARPGLVALSLQNPRHLARAARAEAIVTAMGPIFLEPWLDEPHRPFFIDVWHGVGFKARIASDRALRRLDGHFVSSPHVQSYYESAGVRAHTTGYARTDVTLAGKDSPDMRSRVLAAFGAETPDLPVILFAPTWREAGQSGEQFDIADALRQLSAEAERSGFLVGFRGHSNSSDATVPKGPHLADLDAARFPITEDLLGVVDVLVTDWSSIAIDYLPLDRPVVYLDTAPPSGELGPLQYEDRPGAKAADAGQLVAAVSAAVSEPGKVMAAHAEQRRSTTARAWGDSLDGRSSERYWLTLRRLLDERTPE